jgi:pantothenate kinase
MKNADGEMTPDEKLPMRVAVVGACAVGKSTLVAALRADGYEARHVAQEHSYVQSMWQRIGRPDVLVYLDANYETIKARRPTFHFSQGDLAEQKRRLAHARQHCDLYVDTNELTPAEVRQRCLAFLDDLKAG